MLCGGSVEIFRSCIFCNGLVTGNHEAEMQGFVYLGSNTNCMIKGTRYELILVGKGFIVRDTENEI